jgi:ribosome-binding ATPase YchF (GTP1/OBG family)
MTAEFSRYFLSVDVLSFDDLEEMRTAAEATRMLKFRQQGNYYIVLDGDILFYKIKS